MLSRIGYYNLNLQIQTFVKNCKNKVTSCYGLGSYNSLFVLCYKVVKVIKNAICYETRYKINWKSLKTA